MLQLLGAYFLPTFVASLVSLRTISMISVREREREKERERERASNTLTTSDVMQGDPCRAFGAFTARGLFGSFSGGHV